MLTLMVVFAIAWVWWYYRPTIEYDGLSAPYRSALWVRGRMLTTK